MHLARHSSGHLGLHSSGHLRLWRLWHPGYDVAYSSSSAYDGYDHIDIKDESGSPLFDYFPGRVTAAIAAMSAGSSYYSQALNVRDMYGNPGMGLWHSISAFVRAVGTVYTVAAKSGAPFGAPLADIDVTITRGIAPVVVVGTGASAPTGNPKDWSGTALYASDLLEDIEIGAYVWFSLFVIPPASYSVNGYIDAPYASISVENIRYVAA